MQNPGSTGPGPPFLKRVCSASCRLPSTWLTPRDTGGLPAGTLLLLCHLSTRPAAFGAYFHHVKEDSSSRRLFPSRIIFIVFIGKRWRPPDNQIILTVLFQGGGADSHTQAEAALLAVPRHRDHARRQRRRLRRTRREF